LDQVAKKASALLPSALRRALRRGRRPEIHHSDPGAQYAATAYTDLLAVRCVAISMAAVGKPEDNGFAERLMRTCRAKVPGTVAAFSHHRFPDLYPPFSLIIGSWTFIRPRFLDLYPPGPLSALVDAVDEQARGFYLHRDFEPFQDDPSRLFLMIRDLHKAGLEPLAE
jgi:transposase InsO family protein